MTEHTAMVELNYNGNKLKVDPLNGAAITYWSCQKNDEDIALINNRGFNLFEGSLLFPFPNRLASGTYTFEGKTFSFPKNDFGRPNALHGLIYDQEFELVDKTDKQLRFKYKYSGNHDCYPFPYIFGVTYSLNKNELELNFEVLNTGTSDMPCGFGWHPYFDIELSEQSCRFKLPKVSHIHVDENLVPTGSEEIYTTFKDLEPVCDTSLDHCFRLEKIEERNSAFLNYPNLGTLEIWQDINCPFIQVFKPDERAMAIESMTCGVNAFNSKEGLKILSPQDSWAFKLGLKFF